jgi:spore coat polysaccharide biosynthesis predicted glycosyltransferase SpsG
MSKITIITDGNKKLGMGHVYQALTLALDLTKKSIHKRDIIFITKSDSKFTNIIKESGFKTYHRTTDAGIYKMLVAAPPKHVIFDKLDVSTSLVRKIKSKLKVKLTIMTNLTKANNFADVTVLGHSMCDFSNIVRRNKKNGKVEFFGPKYWLLRPDFYKYSKRKHKKPKKIQKILLMFGGTDPTNFSSLVLDKLLQMNQTFNITLVLGAGFSHQKKLKSVLKKHSRAKNNVKILKKIKNVAERMFHSDVIFASPGLTFFEALLVGTPVLGFHHNELQRLSYKGFSTTIGKSKLKHLSSIIKNKKFTYPSSSAIVSLKIGKGKNEIVDEILK